MRPILVINPRRDSAFVAFAEEALEVESTPEAFQALLRLAYPHVTVRARALSAERMTVWYVYRDGLWVADQAPEGDGDA